METSVTRLSSKEPKLGIRKYISYLESISSMAIKYANVRSEGFLVIILEASKSVYILLYTRKHIKCMSQTHF